MRSAIISFCALAAATLVAGSVAGSGYDDKLQFDVVKRQASATASGSSGQPVQSGVPISQAAMTDANGNILAFDSANVYKAGVAAGL